MAAIDLLGDPQHDDSVAAKAAPIAAPSYKAIDLHGDPSKDDLPASQLKAPKATPLPKATPTFNGPLFGMQKPKGDMAQPFATPATKILDTGNAAITSAFTPPKNSFTPSLYDQAAGKNPKPSFTQRLGGDLSAVWKAPKAPQESMSAEKYLTDIYGPKGTVGKGGIVGDTLDAWKKLTEDEAPQIGDSETDRIAKLGKVGLDAVSAFFAPVSSVFEHLATYKGPVGDTADVVNRIFSTIGVTGGDALEGILRASPLSQEQKDKLAPTVKGIGALAAQIIAGKAGEKTFTELKTKTNDFLQKAFDDANLKALSTNPAIMEDFKRVQKEKAASERLTAQASPNPVAEMRKIPIKIAQPTFKKELLEEANTKKATEMPPELRQQIRKNVQEHGELATHTELVKSGIGARQADALIREAPTPQTHEEEIAAHQSALRTAVGDEYLSPDKMKVIEAGPKAKPTIDTIDADTGKVTKGVAPKPEPAGKAIKEPKPTSEPKPAPVAAPAAKEAPSIERAKESVLTSGHDYDMGIKAGDLKREDVFTETGALQPKLAEHTIDDMAQKMDRHYQEGAGERFKKGVNMDNPTIENLQEQAAKFLDSEGKGAPKIKKEPGVSKVGKSVEAKAIEDKLTTGFDNTAKYDVKSFKVAAEKTAELINSGIENARSVIRGEKPKPEGTTSGSIIAGVEEYAKAHPQEAPDIMSELANSRMATETSTHAQELGSLRMREPDSATAHLQNLKKILVDAAGGIKKVTTQRSALIKEARAAIKSVNLSKEDVSWDKFLDTITC